jgi:hypothetical protein
LDNRLTLGLLLFHDIKELVSQFIPLPQNAGGADAVVTARMDVTHFITLLNSHADATSGRALNAGITFPAGVLITFRLSFGFVRSTNFFGSIFLGVTIL